MTARLTAAGELIEAPETASAGAGVFVAPTGLSEPETLAAIAAAVDQGAQVVVVEDAQSAADFLTVRAALRGERPVPPDLRLADRLRAA